VYIGFKVYDILRRQVATIADGHRRAGAYRVLWEGTDREDKQVPSGIYFCQLQAEKLREQVHDAAAVSAADPQNEPQVPSG